MPLMTHETLDGYAWCEDSFCDGNAQQPVRVVRDVAQRTFKEWGGDYKGVENTHEYFRFADETEIGCPECGKPRACGAQERPRYPHMLSRLLQGTDPDQRFLLRLIRDGKVQEAAQALGGREGAGGDEIAQLREQIAELRGALQMVQPQAAPAPQQPAGDQPAAARRKTKEA